MGSILITGALGNVGGFVAKYAIKMGEKVVLADIDLDKLRLKYPNQDVIYFDFTDSKTFKSALKEVDRVFIMRPPHLGKPEDLKPFIDVLKDNGEIKLVSFLSLIGVENNPVPPHHKIEKYIEKAKLPYAHIRPSFFMQNISGIHAFEIKYFNNIVVPVKKALTSFIDAEDIGEITATILTNPDKYKNKGYSLTGPEAIDYYEVAKILSEELSRKIVYANPKPRLAKQYWINIRKLDKEYCNVMSMLYMMTRLGTAKKTTNTFEEILSKKPTSFRQFVQKNLDVWND